MRLQIALRHRFAGFTLDLAFEAPAGITALFGRSGSGKTTVINAVAGLMRPDEGKVRLGEVDEITLDIHGTVVERLDDPNDASDDAVVEDEGDEDAVAGPIAIAVDVNEADSTAPANADNPTP